FLFFFSSRRRHTRFSRDWSSDVCSSISCDHLMRGGGLRGLRPESRGLELERRRLLLGVRALLPPALLVRFALAEIVPPPHVVLKIGRASCRGRVETSVVAPGV